MSLRFELCKCHRHGRFIGDEGMPVEIGSREAAKAMLEEAERADVLGPGDRTRIKAAVAASVMAVKDEWIEDGLRQRLTLWNLAAASTNDYGAFATSDFHAYCALIDGIGQDDSAA